MHHSNKATALELKRCHPRAYDTGSASKQHSVAQDIPNFEADITTKQEGLPWHG